MSQSAQTPWLSGASHTNFKNTIDIQHDAGALARSDPPEGKIPCADTDSPGMPWLSRVSHEGRQECALSALKALFKMRVSFLPCGCHRY